MSSYDDIDTLESFSVSTVSGATGELFANGLQQITLYVRLVALDANGDYVIFDKASEATRLKDMVYLIDANSRNALNRIIGSADATSASAWSYTLEAGKYEQLTITRETSPAADTEERADKINTITFYLMCPESVTTKQISVAAALELTNGKHVDTAGSSGFNSTVKATAYSPIIYKFSNDGLKSSKTTEFQYNAGEGGWSNWGYNYHITLASTQNPSPKVKDQTMSERGLPEGHDSIIAPGITAYIPTFILSRSLAFAAYRHYHGRGGCYVYTASDPLVNQLGSGGYYEKVNSRFQENAFNFSAVHFNAYEQDNAIDFGAVKLAKTITITFHDQYGNPGKFKAEGLDKTSSENVHDTYSDIVFSDF